MPFVRRTIAGLLFRFAGLRRPDRFQPDLALGDWTTWRSTASTPGSSTFRGTPGGRSGS